jgi:hypothetical protein
MAILVMQTGFPSGNFGEWFRKNRPSASLAMFVGIFMLYTVATAGFFWQWIPSLHLALIGPPEDNMQDFWNTYYAVVASHPDGFFFTNLIRFPEGTFLYYHSFAYPMVFAIGVLSKFFGTDLPTLVHLQNLGLLFSFPLAAAGAFYLVRHLTGNALGALVGGAVFAFNPSHVEHVMHHAHVSSIEFIPFFVLTYLLALERRSIFWLGWAIAFYALSTLSCWYYLFYIAYFIAFHTFYVATRHRTLPSGWNLFSPLACLVGVVVLLSPLLLPMVRVAMISASVYETGSDTYVADLAAYVAFPKFHILSTLANGIYRRLTGNVWEATVYLGLVNLAVIALLCLVAKKNDKQLLLYALSGMVLFCVFASGDWLHLLGHKTIPMPDLVLSKLPFFRNVRTPSRAIVFVYLFLAIIIGHAVALAWRHRHRSVVRWGISLATALIILDFYPATTLPMTSVTCSSGLANISTDPERGFGVLNLPSRRGKAYIEGNFNMLQQVCHGRPICQGNTSRDLVVTLRDRLETQDLEAQRQQLAEVKVKYIVINHPSGRLFEWSADDGLRDEYTRIYPVVYDGPDLTVLRVY